MFPASVLTATCLGTWDVSGWSAPTLVNATLETPSPGIFSHEDWDFVLCQVWELKASYLRPVMAAMVQYMTQRCQLYSKHQPHKSVTMAGGPPDSLHDVVAPPPAPPSPTVVLPPPTATPPKLELEFFIPQSMEYAADY
uniref:Uncharacterized protein n=1 Tax=Ustilago esculenta TaxID=185366 RepID=A0A481SHJ3_9BASI|nr:hypothetical protein UE_1438 [Ustilago esculenta]